MAPNGRWSARFAARSGIIFESRARRAKSAAMTECASTWLRSLRTSALKPAKRAGHISRRSISQRTAWLSPKSMSLPPSLSPSGQRSRAIPSSVGISSALENFQRSCHPLPESRPSRGEAAEPRTRLTLGSPPTSSARRISSSLKLACYKSPSGFLHEAEAISRDHQLRQIAYVQARSRRATALLSRKEMVSARRLGWTGSNVCSVTEVCTPESFPNYA